MEIAPLQQSAPYATAMMALGVPTHRIGPALTLHRRVPLLGDLIYLPRATCPDDLPPGPCLINAPDPAADTRHHTAGHIPVMTPQIMAVLDLRPDDPARMAAQHGKWRNRLRRAAAAPLKTHACRFDPARHGWLLGHETHQRKTRRYRALPHTFTCAYPCDQTLLLTATRQNRPVAAMLFLLHAPGATYHIGWSNPEGHALNAHTLLLWRASQILRTRSVTHLELGPLDTRTAPGLARFKLGSGAIPVKLGHTWLSLPVLSPLLRTFRHWGGFPSGLFG